MKRKSDNPAKAIDEAMVQEALKAVSIIPKLKPEERGPYLSALLMISYKLLRTVEGDPFVRGWLESALDEVKTSPPDVAIREFH
ncbi:hypothetical protein [Massilia sp. LC238]|uniref:hypothetical protein n=1 Tax=Massilia sp. LC238 TaxID=1502852 RepID=UPI0004E347F7|nr:hypothetical protein [Massilia sp. LC238]KFC61923.1 hypothetical protein FG94_04963 [Massilia sp. LC238]